MLGKAKDWLRRRVRAWEWADDYPILLPHVTVRDGEVELIDGTKVAISGPVAQALRLCDGTRMLRQVADASPIALPDMIACHDQNWIVFWPRPIALPDVKPTRKPTYTDLIVVSPHPDDAALSVGGYLSRNPQAEFNLTLLDVFTRTAWWRLDAKADPDRITAVRKAEESLVARMLGAELVMLDLPEALLRGYGEKDLFAGVARPSDDTIQSDLKRVIEELVVARPNACWIIPLGVGRHVDHQLVRDVARDVFGSQPWQERRDYGYYEDLPYAAEQPHAGHQAAFAPDECPTAALTQLGPSLRWKLELNRVYWSQFSWTRIRGLGEYAKSLGKGVAMERLWVPPGREVP